MSVTIDNISELISAASHLDSHPVQYCELIDLSLHELTTLKEILADIADAAGNASIAVEAEIARRSEDANAE